MSITNKSNEFSNVVVRLEKDSQVCNVRQMLFLSNDDKTAAGKDHIKKTLKIQSFNN